MTDNDDTTCDCTGISWTRHWWCGSIFFSLKSSTFIKHKNKLNFCSSGVEPNDRVRSAEVSFRVTENAWLHSLPLRVCYKMLASGSQEFSLCHFHLFYFLWWLISQGCLLYWMWNKELYWLLFPDSSYCAEYCDFFFQIEEGCQYVWSVLLRCDAIQK